MEVWGIVKREKPESFARVESREKEIFGDARCIVVDEDLFTMKCDEVRFGEYLRNNEKRKKLKLSQGCGLEKVVFLEEETSGV